MPATTAAAPGPSTSSAPRRVQLRRLGPLLTATEVRQPTVITQSDGSQVSASTGDWIVTTAQSKSVLTVIKAAVFPAPYALLQAKSLDLTSEEIARIEDTAGIGALRSGASLCQAVERLASIAIGEIKIPFTPGQLEELQHRAAKRGQTVEQSIKAVVERIREELFWRS